MTSALQVTSFDTARSYDIAVYTCGYEQRSTFIAHTMLARSGKNVVFGFTTGHVLHYDENKAYFEQKSLQVQETSDSQFRQILSDLISEDLRNREQQATVLVDYSSMTRLRMAMLWELRDFFGDRVTWTFLYSKSHYASTEENNRPFLHIGPVSSFFAGWSTRPELPVKCIVAVGAESERATGSIEQIQPEETIVFIPRSVEASHDHDTRQRNRSLARFINGEEWVYYDIEKPIELYTILEGIVFGLRRSNRVVVLPFGPKMFTMVAMLVAVEYPDVAVWRISKGDLEEHIDRVPSGEIIGFTVTGQSQSR